MFGSIVSSKQQPWLRHQSLFTSSIPQSTLWECGMSLQTSVDDTGIMKQIPRSEEFHLRGFLNLKIDSKLGLTIIYCKSSSLTLDP